MCGMRLKYFCFDLFLCTPQNVVYVSLSLFQTLILCLRGFTCSKEFQFFFLFLLSFLCQARIIESNRRIFYVLCIKSKAEKNDFKRHSKGGNRTNKQKTTCLRFSLTKIVWCGQVRFAFLVFLLYLLPF